MSIEFRHQRKFFNKGGRFAKFLNQLAFAVVADFEGFKSFFS